jgi:hypothetical protein
MKNVRLSGRELDQYLGCYGSYSTEDTICQTHCALSLRCAIEKDHHAQMELLEDLMSSSGYSLKMQ